MGYFREWIPLWQCHTKYYSTKLIIIRNIDQDNFCFTGQNLGRIRNLRIYFKGLSIFNNRGTTNLWYYRKPHFQHHRTSMQNQRKLCFDFTIPFLAVVFIQKNIWTRVWREITTLLDTIRHKNNYCQIQNEKTTQFEMCIHVCSIVVPKWIYCISKLNSYHFYDWTDLNTLYLMCVSPNWS